MTQETSTASRRRLPSRTGSRWEAAAVGRSGCPSRRFRAPIFVYARMRASYSITLASHSTERVRQRRCCTSTMWTPRPPVAGATPAGWAWRSWTTTRASQACARSSAIASSPLSTTTPTSKSTRPAAAAAAAWTPSFFTDFELSVGGFTVGVQQVGCHTRAQRSTLNAVANTRCKVLESSPYALFLCKTACMCVYPHRDTSPVPPQPPQHPLGYRAHAYENSRQR
mmetsp:Transcript_5963/g.19971  ORF Transcript_5963/g.19971 Transcript_5963/m.19971 type:complete len:225 (-) Transcript_5963:684-1358(-)